MRKLQSKPLVPKPTDVMQVTQQFFGEGFAIDVPRLVEEVRLAEGQHPYTKKENVGGWKSIPLRSAGGVTGQEGSKAAGPHKSSDPAIFADTEIMQVTPYIAELVKQVAGQEAEAGVLKVRLMQLEPHRVITEHVDMFNGEKARLVRRFHIPILTNPKIAFFVNRKRYYLEPGQLYHLDVSQFHSVENNSDLNRVHLVFDVMATERVRKFLSLNEKTN
jgi:hypothetical protein